MELLGLTRDGIAYQAYLSEESRTLANVQNYREIMGFSALPFLAHCLLKILIFFGDFSVNFAYLKVSTLQAQSSSENFIIKKNNGLTAHIVPIDFLFIRVV